MVSFIQTDSPVIPPWLVQSLLVTSRGDFDRIMFYYQETATYVQRDSWQQKLALLSMVIHGLHPMIYRARAGEIAQQKTVSDKTTYINLSFK